MRILDSRVFKGAVAVAAAVLVTAAIGVIVNAQAGPPPAPQGGQGVGPGGQGMGPGCPCMVGRGPGMRGGRGGGPGGPFAFFGRGLRQLNLTDAQDEKVHAIMEAHRAEFKALRARAEAARKALHEAVAADKVDEAVIRAKAGDLAAVQADEAVLGAKVRAAVFAVLTPEQQQKAKEMRSRMEQRMTDRGGHMGRWGR